ncbi:MAG: hypothetical protein MRJ65_10755 [Candidatus Brocadiaceae bacterium]|nr:hypothetical protein [Candidatus Brocadiaceae bacterium]
MTKGRVGYRPWGGQIFYSGKFIISSVISREVFQAELLPVPLRVVLLLLFIMKERVYHVCLRTFGTGNLELL